MYFGSTISESADLDTEIKRRIGAARASVRIYSSQLYNRQNACLSLKIGLFDNWSLTVRIEQFCGDQ